MTETDGNDYAIVVKYVRFGLTKDFLGLLTSLKKAGVKTIVVCNGTLSDKDRAILKTYVHRILVRQNIGRDMGAYRAATLHLHKTGLRPHRMLYFNDSVIYLDNTHLETLIRNLVQSNFDVVGTFENHQIHHHIGSYALSISGAVFSDKRVLKFWKGYRPYDLRPHAIRRGEIAYSILLKKLGYRLDVIYSADKLARLLSRMELEQITGMLQFMRPSFRMQPLPDLLKQPMSAIRLVPRMKKVLPRRNTQPVSGTPTIKNYRSSRNISIAPSEREEGIRDVTVQLARQSLIDRIMLDITAGSQIHMGFGLFHRIMHCPLIKKDLLFRGIYHEHDCAMIIQGIPDEDRDFAMRELINRGRNLSISQYNNFLMFYGLV